MNWSYLDKANGFDIRVANFCAQASSDAYLDKSFIGALEDKWKCNVRLIDVAGTQAMVFDGPQLVIAFRGTEPDKISDWLSGLGIWKHHWGEGMWAHGGFMRAYLAVKQEVRKECLKAAGRDIFLTGHSLGGALANVAMWDLETTRTPVRRLYTFGSPRVFGWKMAQRARNQFNGRQFRVMNRNDIVPRVPSGLRFQHTGVVGYINRFNEIQINPVSGYVTYDRILGFRANMLRSHLMKHYIKGTEK